MELVQIDLLDPLIPKATTIARLLLGFVPRGLIQFLAACSTSDARKKTFLLAGCEKRLSSHHRKIKTLEQPGVLLRETHAKNLNSWPKSIVFLPSICTENDCRLESCMIQYARFLTIYDTTSNIYDVSSK